SYEASVAFPFSHSPPAAPPDARHSLLSSHRRHSTGSVPQSAFRAEPAENKFGFAKNPLAEGGRGRPGYRLGVHEQLRLFLILDSVKRWVRNRPRRLPDVSKLRSHALWRSDYQDRVHITRFTHVHGLH